MKILLLTVALSLLIANAGFAQSTTPVAAAQTMAGDSLYPRQAVAPMPVPDSVQEMVHKLFKRARLYSTIGIVSSSLVTFSETRYAIEGRTDWLTGLNLYLGVTTLAAGIVNRVRFSHRRELRVLSALERGQPLPPYATQWAPLLVSGKPRR